MTSFPHRAVGYASQGVTAAALFSHLRNSLLCTHSAKPGLPRTEGATKIPGWETSVLGVLSQVCEVGSTTNRPCKGKLRRKPGTATAQKSVAYTSQFTSAGLSSSSCMPADRGRTNPPAPHLKETL